jgi:hypothetical protein
LGCGLRQIIADSYSFDNALKGMRFSEGELDADLPVDLRKTNTGAARLGQIETTEMIEVQLVNSVAPCSCVIAFEVMKRQHWKNITINAGNGRKFHRFSRKTDIRIRTWQKLLIC